MAALNLPARPDHNCDLPACFSASIELRADEEAYRFGGFFGHLQLKSKANCFFIWLTAEGGLLQSHGVSIDG